MLDLLCTLLFCSLCQSRGLRLAFAEVVCGKTDFFSTSCPEGYKCCGQYGEHCCKDEAYLGKEYIENDIRQKIDEKRREEIERIKQKNNITGESNEKSFGDSLVYMRSSIVFMALMVIRSSQICCIVAVCIVVSVIFKYYFFGGIPTQFAFKRADDTKVTCYKLLPDQPITTRLQPAAAAGATSDPVELIWTTEIHENIHHQISEYHKWFTESENPAAKTT